MDFSLFMQKQATSTTCTLAQSEKSAGAAGLVVCCGVPQVAGPKLV